MSVRHSVIMDKLAKKIRHLRNSRGLTQLKLALEIGTDPQQISRWERDVSSPSYENLVELAKFFEVDPQWLFGLKLTGDNSKVMNNIEPPYHAWNEWLVGMAPDDLTPDERFMLSMLRFSAEPEPWRYSAILEQLRGPASEITAKNKH